jgi:hypothetical protein
MRRILWVSIVCAACSEQQFDGPLPVHEDWLVHGDVDIVVFTDTSESMGDQLATLAENVDILVSRLDEVDADWQLAAVTGPDGCAQQGVLTGDTPGWQDKFATGIQTPPGEDLVDEWGLYDAGQALAAATPGGCNDGFLREDAYLHIVFISDEDDNSPGFDEGDPDYWQPYVDQYVAAKGGDAAKVHLSAVGGPQPIGCSSADFAKGYWEAVEATGGQFLSICDDWEFQIDALADTSVVQSAFSLEQEPDQDSVRVFVDGLERVDGWVYRDTTNEVVFEAEAPYAGQEVEVNYTVTAY